MSSPPRPILTSLESYARSFHDIDRLMEDSVLNCVNPTVAMTAGEFWRCEALTARDDAKDGTYIDDLHEAVNCGDAAAQALLSLRTAHQERRYGSRVVADDRNQAWSLPKAEPKDSFSKGLARVDRSIALIEGARALAALAQEEPVS